MAPQADESFSVGFVYFTENLSHHGYMCPVCRGVFKELSDLQDDLRRHKVDASNVTLPVRPLWFRSIEDGSRDASWLNVEIPGGEFLKHIHNDREKKDVRTPAVTIKMEWDQLTDETMLLEATDVSAEQYKVETGSADGFSDRTPDEDDEDDAPDYDISYDDDDCMDPDFTEKNSPRTRKNSRRPGRKETVSATVTSADVGGKDSEEKKNLADNKSNDHPMDTIGGNMPVRDIVGAFNPVEDTPALQKDISCAIVSNEDGWFSCPKCPKKMKSRSSIRRHINQHPCEEPARDRIGTNSNISKNMKKTDTKSTGTIHRCHLCPFTATNGTSLSRHRRRVHLGLYQCDECDKKFLFRWELRQHKNSKHTLHNVEKHKSFVCPICGKVLGSKSGLNCHKRSAHDKNFRFVCGQCGQGFNERNKFVGHMNKHLGQKPFHCSKCQKGFAREDKVKHHERSCGKRKLSKKSPEITQHVCTVCNKNFSAERWLKEHQNAIHFGVQHECVCGHSYSWLACLRRHQKTCQQAINHKGFTAEMKLLCSALDAEVDGGFKGQVDKQSRETVDNM